MRKFSGSGRTAAIVLLFAMVGALVPALAASPAAAADCEGANAIVCENARPGNPPSEWNVGNDGDPSIQGFATDMSVNVGDTVGFKVETDASDYTVKIFRIGYYGGDGARLVDTVTPTATLPQVQPACLTDASGLVDCGNWSESASWAVPGDAVSGVYEALLSRPDTGGDSAITFVVRDDASTSDILYQTSDATWQAYNIYGGNNLYTGTSAGAAGAAYKVSYNRPLLGRTNGLEGNSFFAAEMPMVRFLERNGYDVSYFSNVDTNSRGSLIENHRMFLSSGHDEYWSGAMRTNVEAARDAGVNLSFFSGNSIFWRTRFEPTIDGSDAADRTLVSYKETHSGVSPSEVDPTGEWTGTWRDPRFASPPEGGWPENQLMGGLSTVNGIRNDALTVSSAFSDMRIWRNTAAANLAPGTTYTMPVGTLGYEWGGDIDNGFRPAGLVDLSATTIAETLYGAPGGGDGVGGGLFTNYGSSTGPGPATNNLTLYRAASGALVFSTQTVQWSWGLDDVHDAPGTTTDPVMQQATVNLFADMGIQPGSLMPGLTAATATADTTAPTTTFTIPSEHAIFDTGQTVTVTGTAADVDGAVGGVEISVDGSTWHPATPTGADGSWSTWSYLWTPSTLGDVTLRARAADDSANLGATATVTVAVTYSCPCSVFGPAAAPATADSGDATPVEVGLKFRSDVDGYVTGVRFYKAAANTGTHVGTLWSTTGTTLATATFSGESATGWQEVLFSEPVAVTAGTTYVASYSAPAGHYSADNNAFTAAGIDTAPLHALQVGVDGGNGVFAYGAGTFPTVTFGDTNYWVDPVFTDTLDSDTTAPTVVGSTPAGGATEVATSMQPTATFSEGVNAGSITFTLRDAADTVVDGTITYGAASHTATFAPTSPLTLGTVYTATVAGVEDTTGNVMAAPVSWSFTTTATPPDTTAPTVTSTSPLAGATGVPAGAAPLATFSESVQAGTISFTLRDAANTAVAGSTTYDTVTHTATFTPSTQLATSSVYTATVAGARDTAGNAMAGPTTWSFTTTAAASGCPCSIWSAGATPAVAAENDPASVELGVKFRSDTNGWISGVRFYKGSGNTGTHVGNLWSASGTLLATATFSGESASGWQQVSFSSPVAVTANTTYVASYLAPNGRYAATANGLTAAVDTAPLHAVAGAASGGNGVYQYGSTSAFPNSSFQNTNYWVDPVFTDVAPADTAAPTVTATAPTAGATGVATAIAPTATFSEPVQAGSVSFIVRDAANAVVAGATTYDTITHTATFTPSTPLNAGVQFTATVSGALDAAGNAMAAPSTWSFTTAAGVATGPFTIWSAGSSPDVAATGDTGAVELGVKFRADSDGFVSGVRFYKGSGNTGTHVGNLWSASGTLLATATFSGESASGWQQVSFSSPVAVTAATTYVVSYFAPNGHYAATSSGLASAVDNAPLHALAGGSSGGNGVYRYGSASAFPSASYQNTNYWVDAVFTTTPVSDTTAPTVTTTAPTAGATGVATAIAPTATFSEPVQAGSVSFIVRDAANAVVAGATTYDTITHTATFTPSTYLATSSVYTATVSGALDAAGNAMAAPSTWSFTTTAGVATGPFTIWSAGSSPDVAATGDTGAVELGVKFRADSDGFVSGVRFYKGSGNTGTHVGNLWSASGTLLATATFSGESASGWQQVSFSSPVAVTANTTYVVSYFAPNGHYAATAEGLAAAVDNAPLHALAGDSSGGNGVYRYGSASAFPTASFRNTNYWVDTVFTTAPPASDTTAPTVTTTAPTAGATGVATSTAPTATFSEPVQAGTISFTVHDASDTVVAGTVAYDTITRTATFTPSAHLATSSVYTATVNGAQDVAGNTMAAPTTWAFTTADASTTLSTVFSSGVTPILSDSGDASSVELGMKFRSDVAGSVTGVRFFKGVGNTGTHVGNLWSASGTLLATATFSNETASGWQQVTFSSPVAIDANTTYVVSYLAPNGHYAADNDFFATAGFDNGVLHALSTAAAGGNGVYQYGASSTFPTGSYRASNYWVDVVFASA